jgi:nitrite reductase (NADH) small subunit
MAFEPVCREDWLIPDRGAAALINGHQVAIFKLALDGRIVAVDNFDPFSESFVISRGLIGTKQGRPKVTSPIYKQSFYLDSGECLDDPSFRLDVFPVRTVGGMVEVAAGGEFETGSLHDPIPGCDACDPDV